MFSSGAAALLPRRSRPFPRSCRAITIHSPAPKLTDGAGREHLSERPASYADFMTVFNCDFHSIMGCIFVALFQRELRFFAVIEVDDLISDYLVRLMSLPG